mgnify:CR=1 FL=1
MAALPAGRFRRNSASEELIWACLRSPSFSCSGHREAELPRPLSTGLKSDRPKQPRHPPIILSTPWRFRNSCGVRSRCISRFYLLVASVRWTFPRYRVARRGDPRSRAHPAGQHAHAAKRDAQIALQAVVTVNASPLYQNICARCISCI